MNIRWVMKSFFVLPFCAVGALAFPLNPTPFGYDNAGDFVTLQNIGDEHYRFTRTTDGILVVQDSAGVYYYADENGNASKFKAKNPTLRSAEDLKFLERLDKKKSFKSHQKRHPDRLVIPADKKAGPASWANLSETTSDLPAMMRLPNPSAHANGTNRFAVIMVSNKSNADIDSASLWSMLNKGASASYPGSVQDYFSFQSSGKFVPSFDLYRVNVTNAFSSYAGYEYSLVREAIDSLKVKYPNFNAADYDSDNDGEVDALGVLYAGRESSANYMGGFAYWLRYNTGGMYSAGGGKKFNTYFILSQQDNLFPAIIHEFSHTMGLKDHYCVYGDDCKNDFSNSQYQAPGAHAWDVMATGMYNGGMRNPPNYSAFERNFMGWLKYDTLDTYSDVISMKPLAESNKAYKIPVPGKTDEWYILENRQFNDKWDAKLPGHGLLIWHIDYTWNAWNDDSMNDVPSHQRVDVVEAGDVKVKSYSKGFYYGYSYEENNLKDDPFPGSQNVTSYGPFKSWAGADLGVKLQGIMEEDYAVCFTTKNGVKVSTCKVASSSSSAVAGLSSAATVMSSSSSKTVPSSSSEAMAKSSSSLVTSALHAVSLAQAVEMSMNGSVLEIVSRTSGIKRVDIFDLQGNLISRSLFDGGEFSMNLERLSHLGVMVVRVSEGSRILGVKKVTSGN